MFMARTNVRHVKAASLVTGVSAGWFEANHNAVYDFEFTNPLSWAHWFKSASGEVGGSVRFVLGKLSGTGKGWYEELNGTTGRFQLGLSHAFSGTQLLYIEMNSGASLADNLWHHVCVTYDGSSTHAGLKLYIDGGVRTVNTLGTLPGSPTMKNTDTVKLGNTATGVSWSTRLHDFAVWNVELTATQVLDVYGAGRPNGKVPRLEKTTSAWPAPVVYWAMRSGDAFPIPEKMGTGLTMAAQSTPARITR